METLTDEYKVGYIYFATYLLAAPAVQDALVAGPAGRTWLLPAANTAYCPAYT